MADVTISSLPIGTPSGNHLLPYSTGSNTLAVATSAIFQNTTSNIGIGTTNPSAALDVNGDVKITGTLSVQGLDRVYAALTSGPYVYPSGVVKWNAVLTNIGNNYSSSTGYFTATKTGIYRVSAYWISSGAGDYFIRKNNGNYAISHNNHNDTWDNSSMTCLVPLAPGDTLHFFYQQASGYAGGLYGNAYNGYSIEQLP